MTSINSRTYGLFVALMLLVTTACMAPSPNASEPKSEQSPSTEASASPVASQGKTNPVEPGYPTPIRTKPAPPMSDPLPPERALPTTTRNPPKIDQTCKTNADCVVKDVGSCCGAMPACVNRNMRTDPAAVQAECARKGMSSVCGFNEITACTCAGGQCISEQEPVGGWINGAAPPQTDR